MTLPSSALLAKASAVDGSRKKSTRGSSTPGAGAGSAARNDGGDDGGDDGAIYPAELVERLQGTLAFSSKFESGNLRRAERVFDRFCPHRAAEAAALAKDAAVPVQLAVHQEYDLWLREDLHTNGNIQWFYFSVENITAGLTVRFNLVNHNKPDSLFNHGMRPLVYSTKVADLHGTGWVRAGTNCCYYQSANTYRSRRRSRNYYVASFTYTFRFSRDRVYFAYCQPYTFTKLQSFLQVCVYRFL